MPIKKEESLYIPPRSLRHLAKELNSRKTDTMDVDGIDEDDQENLDLYPLVKYIDMYSLPSYLISYLQAISFSSLPWPKYPQLDKSGKGKAKGRSLKEIKQYEPIRVVQASVGYWKNVDPNIAIITNPEHWNKRPNLNLPSWELVAPEQDDFDFLSTIHVEYEAKNVQWDLLAQFMLDYVLLTVSECIRLIEGDQYTEMVWERMSKLQTTRIEGRVWDVFGLKEGKKTKMVIVTVPPWFLPMDEFEAIVGDFDLKEEEDPRLEHNINKVDAANIWAIIYDTCKETSCNRFVFTNHLCWSFGTISPDLTSIRVTESIPASILFLDTETHRPVILGCNALQTLIYWSRAGEEIHGIEARGELMDPNRWAWTGEVVRRDAAHMI